MREIDRFGALEVRCHVCDDEIDLARTAASYAVRPGDFNYFEFTPSVGEAVRYLDVVAGGIVLGVAETDRFAGQGDADA